MGRQYYMSSVEMGEPTDDNLSSEQQGQELLYRNGGREVYLMPGTDLRVYTATEPRTTSVILIGVARSYWAVARVSVGPLRGFASRFKARANRGTPIRNASDVVDKGARTLVMQGGIGA